MRRKPWCLLTKFKWWARTSCCISGPAFETSLARGLWYDSQHPDSSQFVSQAHSRHPAESSHSWQAISHCGHQFCTETNAKPEITSWITLPIWDLFYIANPQITLLNYIKTQFWVLAVLTRVLYRSSTGAWNWSAESDCHWLSTKDLLTALTFSGALVDDT